jgi:hypothetical protein
LQDTLASTCWRPGFGTIQHHRGTPPAAEFRERDGGELRERPLAINQIAQTTLRNMVEQHSQDEVLAETSVINGSIRVIWGSSGVCTTVPD